MSDDWIRAEWPAPGTIVAGTTLRGADDFRFPAEPRWLDQVHGARVVRAGSADFDDGPPAADAVFTAEAGVCVGVVTADCVPVLVSADRLVPLPVSASATSTSAWEFVAELSSEPTV